MNNRQILEDLKEIRKMKEEAEVIAHILEAARVEEGGLSRVLKNMELPFIMITAFRGEYNLSENRKRNAEMLAQFRKYKLGGKHVKGSYIENKGTPNEKKVSEESFFIVLNNDSGLSVEGFKQLGIDMCKKFNQDAMVFSDGKEIFYVEKSGLSSKIGTRLNLNEKKMADFYSQIRGRKFTFEGTSEPSSFTHAYGLKSIGMI